jgi:hypothetical protein
MPKSGYFIGYYTNETDVTVYLDNIVINHRSGPLLQESDTYAFCGSIDALESRSFGRAENKYGYNGKEKQPDLVLEWLDYGERKRLVPLIAPLVTPGGKTPSFARHLVCIGIDC